MIINFSELQELMSPLTQMCKKEKTVEIGGVPITLRSLTPLEETEVQKLLPEITDGASSAMEFADVFRRETLARSIIQVGSMDLRGVETVSTGETLSSGVEKKISKEDAILNILEAWSRPVLSKIFEEFTILSEDIESELDESLKLNIEDTNATSENLKLRSEQIKQAETLASVSEKTSDEQSAL